MRARLLKEAAEAGLPAGPGPSAPVTDADIAGLPEPAQRFLRFRGVVGRPRDWSFCTRFTGRFRRGNDWMDCEAWQYNSGLEVARLFHMRIRYGGIVPLLVRDTYVRGRGRMLARLLDLVTVVDGTGPEIDTGELVTYVNDAVLIAPTMLLGPGMSIRAVDDGSFDVALEDKGRTVRARVFVDGEGAATDFSTTDRFHEDFNDPKGRMIRGRWTTPIEGWQERGGRRLPTRAKAIWHLPEGPFPYADFEFSLDTLAFNVPPGG